MEGFDIIYESLDAKTRKRIDAKLAKRQECDIIQRRESREREEKDGYQWMCIGAIIMVVSLTISLVVDLFAGPSVIVAFFACFAFFGFFITIVGGCTWGHV
jgi:fatty acid desaturase